MPGKNPVSDLEQLDAAMLEAEQAAQAANNERALVAQRAEQVRQAGQAARSAAMLAEMRRLYVSEPKAAREARAEAHVALMAVANADELNVAALMAAFIRRQELDQACYTGLSYMLDQADELARRNTHGAGSPPPRPTGAVPMHHRETWSGFLDETIRRRAANYAGRINRDRVQHIDRVGAEAELEAQERAAQMSGDEILQIAQLESFVERFERIAAIEVTDEAVYESLELEPDGTSHWMRRQKLRNELADRLIAEEASGFTQDDPSGEPPHRNGDEPR